MQDSVSIAQPVKQDSIGTTVPQWALERIREAKERNFDALDLSVVAGEERECLSKLPESLFELTGLTSLKLSNNSLTGLPEAITRLQRLTILDLSANQFSALPEVVTRLPNLTALVLSGNQLSSLPESLTKLQNLTVLVLSGNQFTSLPEVVTQLNNLTNLDLSFNQFTNLPESLDQLRNLTALSLVDNQLSFLPESITQLQHLTNLNLSDNQLTSLPESLCHLQNLTVLELIGNRLTSLPECIDQLQKLTVLVLIGNQLTSLPESIAGLQNLSYLYLADNPLISPPLEVAIQGIKAVREYFRQLNQEGVDYLYEAKLLILGESGAGKTSFAHKVVDSDYILKEEESTKGVDVLKWSFSMEDDKPFKVNIWDFGGQEIYHATHQFFLTRRSLYALVADTRKVDTDFYYWLNIVELLSDSSPLLIIKNEKQNRHREINERQLRAQFNGLKEVLATNLATNRGLEDVKEEIEHELGKLPHIGSPLPRTWVRVREHLEKDPRNYISLEDYLELCEANGFNTTKDSLQLSGYLHDIGVFLHFQDEPLLRKTIILKPKWATDAVYKVLDNKAVIKNLGRFTYADLEEIWNAPEFESMRDELLQLMMKFKLCYEIPNEEGTYIAPQLLTEDQPEYEWNEQESLLLRYSYEFMPKGILTKLIVAMNPYIWEHRMVWKSGVVIEQDQTRAEVIEYYGKREIRVCVTGEQRRDLMTVIRHELKEIHDTYKRLKYDELIQCTCPSCKDSPDPHFYTIAELTDFRANHQLEIQCRKKPYAMVNVMRLLGDVVDLDRLSERDEIVQPIYVAGDYYEEGDNKMTEINQNIEGSTIHGSVVAAESIKDSFNTIEKSDAKEDLKESLTKLTQAVEAMLKELPKEKADQAEEAADYMKRLTEEATREKPNPKWYNVSIDGLIAAAQNLGKVGEAVIDLSGKVRKILTGGLL